MTLNQFLRKNEITISLEVLKLCNEALRRMLNTLDVSHDLTHVERILSDLDAFLANEKTVNSAKINYEILLLSICWHDTWKATRFPSNLRTMLFDQYWDGPGSMLLFAQEAKKAKISPALIGEVKYIIREHGRLHLLPPQCLEAKIFYDLDALEGWSLRRIEILKGKYLNRKINPVLLKIAQFYYERFMLAETEDLYHFAWSKQEFRKRRERYLKEVERLTKQYGHLISS